MKIGILLLLTLLHTVYCKPSDPRNSEIYDEIQNDEEDYDDDDVDETNSSKNVQENTPSSEEPPKIITVGQTIVGNLSGSIKLPCNITGNNFVQVWDKLPNTKLFQEKIAMGAGNRMKQLDDGSLQIFSLKMDDAGNYTCAALVSNKIRPSIKHNLILNYPPQIESLAVKDNNTHLRTGNTLLLTCKANANPKAEIAWHKDSNRFDVTGERLEFFNITRHHAGKYHCFADNKIGAPAIKTITIKVDYKPVIELERLSVTSKNSESKTELKCLVHSEPKATVVWTKNDVNIKNSSHTILNNKENNHILILNDVNDSDFGLYTCLASNYLGHSSKSIKLVKTPIIIEFRNSTSHDKNLTVIWEVQSKTTITNYVFEIRKKGATSWRRVEADVSVDGDDIYRYQHAFNRNFEPGYYETRIKAMNDAGWSDYSKIETFAGVNAKHGHHKSHKKGHKHGKEKQAQEQSTQPSNPIDVHLEHQESVVNSSVREKQTQEQSTQSSNPVDVPAEHQESAIKDSPVGANRPSGCSSIMPSLLVFSTISIAFFQNRLTIRL